MKVVSTSRVKSSEISLIEKHRNAHLQKEEKYPKGDEPLGNGHKLFENRHAFSVSEVAFMVGVSQRSIDRLIKQGELRSLKIGRRKVIPKTDFEAWLHSRE